MSFTEKQGLYNGFGDAMAKAMEFAAAPILFALLGRWLDSRFDTSPVFLVALAVFGFAGMVARTYYSYKARMDAIDASSPWGRGE